MHTNLFNGLARRRALFTVLAKTFDHSTTPEERTHHKSRERRRWRAIRVICMVGITLVSMVVGVTILNRRIKMSSVTVLSWIVTMILKRRRTIGMIIVWSDRAKNRPVTVAAVAMVRIWKDRRSRDFLNHCCGKNVFLQRLQLNSSGSSPSHQKNEQASQRSANTSAAESKSKSQHQKKSNEEAYQ